jgi:hypothetical protein
MTPSSGLSVEFALGKWLKEMFIRDCPIIK